MYGARAAWSRLFLPGADPSRSEPESAPGPWPSGARAALKSGGSATLVDKYGVTVNCYQVWLQNRRRTIVGGHENREAGDSHTKVREWRQSYQGKGVETVKPGGDSHTKVREWRGCRLVGWHYIQRRSQGYDSGTVQKLINLPDPGPKE